MTKKIRIGTRGSKLALWQAALVDEELKKNDIDCQIVIVDSEGDQRQDKPLHEIGGIGLFTRMLDESMRNNKIDIAVHSLKDVPTVLPEDIVQIAVLPRGNFHDILVFKNDSDIIEEEVTSVIGTGSLRRKAQWLRKYAHHTVVGLRGNVQTRLRKLSESDWLGAVFAQAGLERVALLPGKNYIVLDWMIPAPAQGAIMITARKGDAQIGEIVGDLLNDVTTEKMVAIERDFMNTLEGGCTSPIGAHAQLNGTKVTFRGGVYSIDGSNEAVIEATGNLTDKGLGVKWAHEVLAKGGDTIIEEIREDLNI